MQAKLVFRYREKKTHFSCAEKRESATVELLLGGAQKLHVDCRAGAILRGCTELGGTRYYEILYLTAKDYSCVHSHSSL